MAQVSNDFVSKAFSTYWNPPQTVGTVVAPVMQAIAGGWNIECQAGTSAELDWHFSRPERCTDSETQAQIMIGHLSHTLKTSGVSFRRMSRKKSKN